jgi:hypothetical protein
MTSKLETYSEVILPALESGLSYRWVADDLLLLGVEITAQSIWSWHTRRQRRIAKRRSKFLGVPGQAEVSQIQPSVPISLPALLPGGTEPGSATLQALRSRIDEHAKRQEVSPWSGLIDRFPVRR